MVYSCWKCGRGSEGYQGGLLGFPTKTFLGVGVDWRFPLGHQYNLARDIAISKWTHICDSYSTETHLVHMYQDRLKVFNFTYGEEKEDPLPPTTFDLMRIAANMRGLFTDLQIYNRFFKEDDMVTWTSSCPRTKGEIFHWDRTTVNTGQSTEKNVTFIKMDLSKVCPDPSKPLTT